MSPWASTVCTVVHKNRPDDKVAVSVPNHHLRTLHSGVGDVDRAQKYVAVKFRENYMGRYGSIRFVRFSDLTIESGIEEAVAKPSGCGCECPGCDQGYHCQKSHKDCYM